MKHNGELVESKTIEEMLALPDEEFFRKGACHALAIELDQAFKDAGRNDSEIHYLHDKDRTDIAVHVFVKTEAGYYDSHFGPQTGSQIMGWWEKHRDSAILPVENREWLDTPSQFSPISSDLMLCVESSFLSQARTRAIAYVRRHRAEFGI